MRRFYTAESVTEGHPDKVCDRIADTILDAYLKGDPDAHVACEVLATKGTVLLAGEITSRYEPEVLALAEDVVEQTGYDPKDFLFDALIHRQSPDIAGGVQTSREKRGSAGGMVYGSRRSGDHDWICLQRKSADASHAGLSAHRIVRELDAARKSEYIRGILPDGKAQVTVEYEDEEPVRVDTVIVSCQHAEEKSLKVAYGIGMAEPVMVQVDTYGTGNVCEDDCLAAAVPLVFGLTPAQIIQQLRLKRPIYAKTAVYGHFGRKQFPWERTDKAELLRSAVI